MKTLILDGLQTTELIDIIEGLDGGWDRVVLVGHNPSMTELAQHFSSTIEHMPTCAVARFDFDIEAWSDLTLGPPSAVDLACPRSLVGRAAK